MSHLNLQNRQGLLRLIHALEMIFFFLKEGHSKILDDRVLEDVRKKKEFIWNFLNHFKSLVGSNN